MSADPKRSGARDLAAKHLAHGDAIGWFEPLYAQAAGEAQNIPWADLRPNPNLVEWLDAKAIRGEGQTALVVGCGLGDDAEWLSDRGFEVTAFDISPTAIDWCRRRFPTSRVAYEVADLLRLPSHWQNAFDFVFEAYTLQVLPPSRSQATGVASSIEKPGHPASPGQPPHSGSLRESAIINVAKVVRTGGTLLVICRGRRPEDPEGEMPWPLLREELSPLQGAGLRPVQFEEFWDQHETPPVRRFRAAYRRHA